MSCPAAFEPKQPFSLAIAFYNIALLLAGRGWILIDMLNSLPVMWAPVNSFLEGVQAIGRQGLVFQLRLPNGQ
jgi:hypothetical protein